MKIPCENCITLAICKQRALRSNGNVVDLTYLLDNCNIFERFCFEASDRLPYDKDSYWNIIKFFKPDATFKDLRRT